MNDSDEPIHGSEQEPETGRNASGKSDDIFDNLPQLLMSKQADEDMRTSFKTILSASEPYPACRIGKVLICCPYLQVTDFL